jgi:uncharacterized protein YjdB
MKPRDNYKMKRFHRIVAIIVCIAMVAAAVAIGVMVTTTAGFAEPMDDPLPSTLSEEAGQSDGDEIDAPAPPVSIRITRYQKEMNVGEEAAISYEVRNAADGEEVAWTSSDNGIAEVDPDGIVRAVAAGKVEITAVIGDAKTSILVSVAIPVIKPESFDVTIDEFTSEDMLLAVHEIKIGDELHMHAKIEPPDATANGKFVWDASGDGVVTISHEGGADTSAVLKARNAGESTVTVSYVDEGADEAGRVNLNDYRFTVSVAAEEGPASASPVTMTVSVVIAIVAAIIIILIVILRDRERRREEDERIERVERRQREEAIREQARQEERERLMREGYGRGYMDGDADPYERATRMYNAPAMPPPGSDPRYTYDAPPAPQYDFSEAASDAAGDAGDEPAKPFSEDDIR